MFFKQAIVMTATILDVISMGLGMVMPETPVMAKTTTYEATP
ncbi:hypothetical protein [Levilactobacillus brevis]|nr:hypothetical protein [Levilactobacillus brevis]